MIEQKRKEIEELILSTHRTWDKITKLTEELNTLLFEEAIKQKLFSKLKWEYKNEWHLYATENSTPLEKLFQPSDTSAFMYQKVVWLEFDDGQISFYFPDGYKTMGEWVEELNLTIVTLNFETELKALQNRITELKKIIVLSEGLK